MAVNVSPGINIRIHVTSDTDGLAQKEHVDRELAKKLNANQGADYAGMLLYINSEGQITPLTLGEGLQIQNGMLMLTEEVAFETNDDGTVTITGVEFMEQEDDSVMLTKTEFEAQDDGSVMLR